MEFPDKESKRKRAIKLYTGYFLIAVLIGLATMLLIYMTAGYNYDIEDGVVRSGLVFLESKPVSANIFVDNQAKGATSDRLVLPEGKHTLVLKQDKYRDWSKNLTLDGGSVMYLVYPKLIPKEIKTTNAQVYNTAPAWSIESPDRHWLVLQQYASTPVLTLVDITKPSSVPSMNTLPTSQLSIMNGQRGTLKPLAWADDNRHLLLQQTLPDNSFVYLLYDRDNADNTVNLTDKLKLVSGQRLTLRGNKFDKYYIHNVTTGDLFVADIASGVAQTPLLSGVVAFKAYADSLIYYVTYAKATEDEAKLYVLSDKTKTFMLKSLPRDANSSYLLDFAQYKNDWYYLASSASGDKVMVFRNPLKRASAGNKTAINPQMSLQIAKPEFISFSENTRFFAIQSAKNFIIYDADQNKVNRFASGLNIVSGQQAKWMDGHRLWVVDEQKIKIFEFDGDNLQTLTSASPNYDIFFDKDYHYVFSLSDQNSGGMALTMGQLVAN
jgi:hypothetical protein